MSRCTGVSGEVDGECNWCIFFKLAAFFQTRASTLVVNSAAFKTNMICLLTSCFTHDISSFHENHRNSLDCIKSVALQES